MGQLRLGLARLRTRGGFAVLAALVILLAMVFGPAARYLNFKNPDDSAAMLGARATSVDYHDIYISLESKRSLADTFDWWHASWVVTRNTFWRPLTMQAWWIESRAFGEFRTHNWMRASVVLYALYGALFAAFVARLTRRRSLALLSLGLFMLPHGFLGPVAAHFWPGFQEPAANRLIIQWLDQPDLWANCLTLGSLLLALHERWVGALLCAVLAVCFKESGWLTFPDLVIVLWLNGSLARVPKWVYPATGSAILALVALRWSAGPEVFRGYSMGTNANWSIRYYHGVSSMALDELERPGVWLLAASIYGLARWRPRSLTLGAGMLLAAIGVSSSLIALQSGVRLDVGFAMLIEDWMSPVALAMWLTSFVLLWRSPLRKWAVAFVALGLLAALPYAAATQARIHVLTMSAMFQAVLGACMVLALAESAIGRLPALARQQATPIASS